MRLSYPLHLAFSLAAAALASAGCSSADDGQAKTPGAAQYLGLRTPAEGEGFQLRTTGIRIGPGEDLEYCEVLQVPGDGSETYYVQSLEVGNGEGSHHLLLDAVRPGLMRHTHQWGKDYAVWYAGGPRDGQEIFRTPDYDHDILHVFSEPIAVKAGDGFRFECSFDNTEDRPLRFGVNATDEMCFLFGIWWGAEDTTPPPQDCVMTAIGTDGIARPPSEIGFRSPTAEENAACVGLSAVAPRPLTDSCAACYCDSCAVPINDCVADAECKALLDCVIETRCGYDTCLAACPDVFDAHSAGTGLIIPVGQCLLGACAECTE